jgi:hypothetical protein
MTSERSQQTEIVSQGDDQRNAVRDELRREGQLVRSAGSISKPTMALAFGLVFLLFAMIAGSASQWLWVWLLGGAGALSIAWAIHAWTRRSWIEGR